MKIIVIFLLFSFSAYGSSLVKGCEAGKASDCFEYGYEQALAGDQLAPLTYFEKGCDLKDGKSCYALDRVYKKLKQMLDNPEYLVKSCEYSFGVGCFELAKFYFEKSEYLLSVDYLKKGCDLGVKASCNKKSEYDTYFSKILRTQAEELSKEELEVQKKYLDLLSIKMKVKEKECGDKNYNSCTKLANNYLFLANISSAKKWATIACDNKMPFGCLALGEVEQKEGKSDLSAFEKACNLELGTGCLRYAQSIESKNLARSMSYFRRSCQAKTGPIAASCMKYSLYHKSNPKLAEKFKSIACKLDKINCTN